MGTRPTTPSLSLWLGKLLWFFSQSDSVCWYSLLLRPSSDGVLAAFDAKVSSLSEAPFKLFQVLTAAQCVKKRPYDELLFSTVRSYKSIASWSDLRNGSLNVSFYV